MKPLLLSKPLIARIFGKYYFGLNNLDAQLSQILNFKNGYFVELGANDGITQSNTKHFELFKGWKGVLIEPSMEQFVKCKRNRSKRNHFVNAACVSFSNKKEFVEMVYSNLMTTSLNTESDLINLAEHLSNARKFLNSEHDQFHFQARARTLNSILEEVCAPSQINLLSLDVEGSEMEVLKGLNHEQFRFSYVCIECRDITKMREYLIQHDYILETQLSEHDFLFKDGRIERNLR